MNTVLRVFLVLQVLIYGLLASTAPLHPADVKYVEGKAPEDLKAGPDRQFSARIQTKSGATLSFGNNNDGNNGNQEQRVQNYQSPSVETVYESSTTSPGYFSTASSIGHLNHQYSTPAPLHSQQYSTPIPTHNQHHQQNFQRYTSTPTHSQQSLQYQNQGQQQSHSQQYSTPIPSAPFQSQKYQHDLQYSTPTSLQTHSNQYSTPAPSRSQQYQNSMQYSTAAPNNPGQQYYYSTATSSSSGQGANQHPNAHYSSSDIISQPLYLNNGQYSNQDSYERSVAVPEIPAGLLPSPAHHQTHHVVNHQPIYNDQGVHQVNVVTEVPVHQVHQHQGVVQKTINVQQPFIKTRKFEIRRPAIEKQYYDIEERIIVRPAGSVVVELEHPVSKIAKGETITPVGHPQHTVVGDGHHYAGGYGDLVSSTTQSSIISSTESGYQHLVGGVTYAEQDRNPTTIGSFITTTPAPPPPAHITDADSVVVEARGQQNEQYATTTERSASNVHTQSAITPYMITVGEPDFHYPPYVEIKSHGTPVQQQENQINVNVMAAPISQAPEVYHQQSSVNSHNVQLQPQQHQQLIQPTQQTVLCNRDYQSAPMPLARVQQYPQQHPYTFSAHQPIVVGEPYSQGQPLLRIQASSSQGPNIGVQYQHPSPSHVGQVQNGAYTHHAQQGAPVLDRGASLPLQASSFPVQQNQKSGYTENSGYDQNINGSPVNSGYRFPVQQHVSYSQGPHQNAGYIQSSTGSGNAGYTQNTNGSPVNHNSGYGSPAQNAGYSQGTNGIPVHQNAGSIQSSYGPENLNGGQIHQNSYVQQTSTNAGGVHSNQVQTPQLNSYTQSSTLTLPERKIHLVRTHQRPSAAFTQPSSTPAPTNAPVHIVYAQSPGRGYQQRLITSTHSPLQQSSGYVPRPHTPVPVTHESITNEKDQESSTNLPSDESTDDLEDVESNAKVVSTTPDDVETKSTTPDGRRDGSKKAQRGDTVPPRPLHTSSRYENSPNLNVQLSSDSGNGQNQFINQLLYKNSAPAKDDHYGNVPSRVISSTPAPINAKPSESVHTRRIVVNHPFETVQVVEEQEPETKISQVTVNQPTTYQTSSVGLKRVQTSVPVYGPVVHPGYVQQSYVPQPAYLGHPDGYGYHGYH